MQPDDPYILQHLALATYKFEQPDKKAALIKARDSEQARSADLQRCGNDWTVGRHP